MAVSLGYKTVYRDPLGFPEWLARGLPTQSLALAPSDPPSGTAPLDPSVGPLYGWTMIWTLAGIFIGGLALNLTPCVYPLIPITISYFGGRNGHGLPIVHAAHYVAGIAVTNSFLGIFAAFTGGLMGALLQNSLVLIMLAALLFALSLSLFGFWEIRIPQRLMQNAVRSHSGYLGSLFMGLMMGLVAAPCIGPFVLGLLTWVASMGSPWIGFVIFFTLSMGLGLPFFFLALFSDRIKQLPRSGEWMIWVRKVMGWMLVGMALYFLQPLMSKTAGIFATALLFGLAGLHLGWIDKTRAAFKAFEWVKLGVSLSAIVVAVMTFGTFFTKGAGAGFIPYDDSLLPQAGTSAKPVIIDFSAQWCSPCKKLEDVTFRDSRVKAKIEKHFVLMKVDLTRNGNPDFERLLEKYDIKGVPTLVFLDSQGMELKEWRLIEFEPPDQFLSRLDNVLQAQ